MLKRLTEKAVPLRPFSWPIQPQRRQFDGRSWKWLWYLLLGLVATSPALGQEPRATNSQPSIGSETSTDSGNEAQAGNESKALERKIAALIEQLGHPNFQKRRQAEWALQQLGLAAFEQLLEAATSYESSIEIANAASYLINSQAVVWFLETDSIDVQGFLKDYDQLNADQRVGRIKLLAQHAGTDAVLALCRLARYERTELLSKVAAIHLLEVLANREEIDRTLVGSIEQAIGSSHRRGVEWIRQILTDLNLPSGADLAAWKAFCKAEVEVPESAEPNLAARQQQLVLNFHGRVADWILRRRDRADAIAIARSSLELLDKNSHRIGSFVVQLLDEWEMPELVVELSERYSDAFKSSAELGYYLAEAYLDSGEVQRAEQQASETSQRIGELPKAVQRLRQKINSLTQAHLVANNRVEEASRLYERTRFDWAEREYLKALESLDSAIAESASEGKANLQRLASWIRIELSQFYWNAGQNAEAHKILKPLVDQIENRDEEDERESVIREISQIFSDERVLGDYYLYRGLALTEQDEFPAARDALKKALENVPSNPDVIIAMRPLAETPEFREFYDEKLDAMRDVFRREVVKQEVRRASTNSRDQRREVDSNLAEACNQLAWLLGKCEVDVQEAVRLAERAVALQSRSPAYLDTLARCYFSAGQFSKAVETQRKAVSLAPYERLMIAQLQEFERRLAVEENSSLP